MSEVGFIDETEFKRVAAEATARMTKGDWSFKRAICIYETNYCTGCMRCADEDLISEANSNYMKAVF
jgi:iron only hydrogenase large subunit-like protein